MGLIVTSNKRCYYYWRKTSSIWWAHGVGYVIMHSHLQLGPPQPLHNFILSKTKGLSNPSISSWYLGYQICSQLGEVKLCHLCYTYLPLHSGMSHWLLVSQSTANVSKVKISNISVKVTEYVFMVITVQDQTHVHLLFCYSWLI